MVAFRFNRVIGLVGAAALLSACSGSRQFAMTPGATSSATRPSSSDQQTFSYTGAEQSFKVPSDVNSITIVADGAAGGTFQTKPKKIPRGGRTQATVSVTPSEKLYVFVGGEGASGSGGFTVGARHHISGGYGGGGASDVERAAMA